MREGPPLLLGRYELLCPLGEGGHGITWRARDRLTLTEVAIKQLHPSSSREHAQRLRREIAALRVLRVPGVVRFVDTGEHVGAPVLVMELVEGRAFPASDGWLAALRVTARLLATLARLHAVGVVHGDLKPSNVLVTPEGRPVVLDFGGSRGAIRALSDTQLRGVGSRAWLAPEQRLGAAPTPLSDLYAVGAMLFQALAGVAPCPADDPRRPLPGQPPPRLGGLVAGVPAALDDWVAALMEPAPEDRPLSALDALRRLADGELGPHVRSTLERAATPARDAAAPCGSLAEEIDRLAQGPSHAAEVFTEGDLCQLFAGPERVLHLPSDAARILHARTRGVPDAIVETLNAWVSAGVAQWDGDRLEVSPFILDEFLARVHLAEAVAPTGPGESSASVWDARSLDRLLAPDDPALDPAEALRALTARAIELATAWSALGRHGMAMTLLADVLGVARVWVTFARAEEEALLVKLCKVALQGITQHALDLASYEIDRARASGATLTWLRTLLEAALVARTNGEHALALAEGLAPSSDAGLDGWRHVVRMRAARRCPTAREAGVLKDVRAWATDHDEPFVRAMAANLESRFLYRLGRYREAAECAEAAVGRDGGLVLELGAMTSAASAWLEAFELDRARRWAALARDRAAERRHAYFEARAEALLRRVDYHAARELAPDHELVQAVALLGENDLHDTVLIVEAAVAWRRGDRATAVELAAEARESCGRSGLHDYAMLARAVELAAGAACPEAEVAALAARACHCETRGMGLQTLGVLASRGATVSDAWREAALRDAERIPRHAWSTRMDLLSVTEALAHLGI